MWELVERIKLAVSMVNETNNIAIENVIFFMN